MHQWIFFKISQQLKHFLIIFSPSKLIKVSVSRNLKMISRGPKADTDSVLRKVLVSWAQSAARGENAKVTRILYCAWIWLFLNLQIGKKKSLHQQLWAKNNTSDSFMSTKQTLTHKCTCKHYRNMHACNTHTHTRAGWRTCLDISTLHHTIMAASPKSFIMYLISRWRWRWLGGF